MAKTYIHKKTKWTAEEIEGKMLYHLIIPGGFKSCAPCELIENTADWQLQEEIQVPPPRIPIVILKDENGRDVPIYEKSDMIWFIKTDENWNIDSVAAKFWLQRTIDNRIYVATQPAAIKYVRENKPVLPLSFLDELINKSKGGKMPIWFWNTLEKHKPKQ